MIKPKTPAVIRPHLFNSVQARHATMMEVGAKKHKAKKYRLAMVRTVANEQRIQDAFTILPVP